MSELSAKQMMDIFERLIKKSVSGGRFSDHDSDYYQILRNKFINAFSECNVLKAKLEVARKAMNEINEIGSYIPLNINNVSILLEELMHCRKIAHDALAEIEKEKQDE